MESALMQGKRLRKLKKREGASVKTIRCFSRFFFNYSFFFFLCWKLLKKRWLVYPFQQNQA